MKTHGTKTARRPMTAAGSAASGTHPTHARKRVPLDVSTLRAIEVVAGIGSYFRYF